ncbi:MAG: ABC transporter permease subunit [Anaerolineales bacterium]|nr:ABC transporter permease subunit [Anaerolineales bacterium]
MLPPPPPPRSAWWRDERFLQFLAQAVFVIIVAGIGYFLFQNMVQSLAKQGMVLGYEFLESPTGFDISTSLIEHARESSNLRSIAVGVINTIVASLLGIVLATILGVLVGIASLSRNYLVNRFAWSYIEIFRNIPLLLVIFFTYTLVIFNLPAVRKSFHLPGEIFLSNRGLYMPKPLATATTGLYLIIGVVLLIGTFILVVKFGRRRKLDYFQMSLITLGIWLLGLLAAWLVLPEAPFQFELPRLKGLNYVGGAEFTPEFVAIVLGLVLGSAPFIADTVRAGIQSVSKGQVDAARALGMSGYLTMRLIIFPQALRVIIPPMTSNYLSLTKNSTLAAAVGYPELLHVSSSITSQTGRAVEMMSILMAIYLALSLLTSLVMNWYNKRVQLVER